MTQNQLNNLIIKLKCCSSVKADEMSTSAKIGQCINYKELVLLNDYIEQLQHYNLEYTEQNCLDEDQITNIINQSKNICNLCDCGIH